MSAWTCRQFAGKAAQKIVPPHPRIPCWKGLRADSEEKREPVSDFNAGVVDSLKALDPKRPIRETAVSDAWICLDDTCVNHRRNRQRRRGGRDRANLWRASSRRARPCAQTL